jgi:hypothetical protein
MQKKSAIIRQLVLDQITKHPEKPYLTIAKECGVGESFVKDVARANNIRRPTGPGAPSWRLKLGSKMGRKPKAVPQC